MNAGRDVHCSFRLPHSRPELNRSLQHGVQSLVKHGRPVQASFRTIWDRFGLRFLYIGSSIIDVVLHLFNLYGLP
ncbi:hypothetical protein ES319_D05G273500v1 [Gossypium barbadense]|uniref:Uncharacterized protein n=2 Tax=Gossypium TaxID=3633 RepID=A0A5J5RL29_GOSBA|nr:hypothetical protein ES319_D05G273500v1 [Gossypium barbadense]TYG70128.1 hypothetical protein ES288_D05G287700v1 [Gossypium darwinii]